MAPPCRSFRTPGASSRSYAASILASGGTKTTVAPGHRSATRDARTDARGESRYELGAVGSLPGSVGTVPLRGNLDVLHLTRRGRNRQTVLAKALDVKDDCFAYLCFDFSNCDARGNAAGKVWHVCRVVAFGPFNDNGVAHKPSPETSLLQDATRRPQSRPLHQRTSFPGAPPRRANPRSPISCSCRSSCREPCRSARARDPAPARGSPR